MAWSVPSTPNNQWLIVNNFTAIPGNTSAEDHLLCYAYAQGYTGIIINVDSVIVDPSFSTFYTKAATYNIKIIGKVFDDTSAANFISYQSTSSKKFASVIIDLDYTSYNNKFVSNNYLFYYNLLSTHYSAFHNCSTSVSGFRVVAINRNPNNYGHNYNSPLAIVDSIDATNSLITFDWSHGTGYIESGDTIKLYNYPTLGVTTEVYVLNSSVNISTGQLEVQTLNGTLSVSIPVNNGSIYTLPQFKLSYVVGTGLLLPNNKTWLFTDDGLPYPLSSSFTPSTGYFTVGVINSLGNSNPFEISVTRYDSVNNVTDIILTSSVPAVPGDYWLNADIAGSVPGNPTNYGLGELEWIYNYVDEYIFVNSTNVPSYSSVRDKVTEIGTYTNNSLGTRNVGFLVNTNASNPTTTFFTGNNGLYPRKNSLAAYKYLATSTTLSPPQIGSPLYAGLESDANVIAALTLSTLIIEDYDVLSTLEIGNGDNIYAQSSIILSANAFSTVAISPTFCDDCLAIDPTTGQPGYTATYYLTTVPTGATIGSNCGFISGVNYINPVTSQSTGCINTPTTISQNLKIATPGTYKGTITIQDATTRSQKQIIVPFTVNVTGNGTASIVQTGTSSCPLGHTNQITVTVTGNSGPFNYYITNPDGTSGPTGSTVSSPFVVNNIGSNTGSPSNPTGSGIYSIYITNSSTGVILGTTSFSIVEPTPVNITSISSTPNLCYGGSFGTATVVASGGTPPYTYSWTPTGGTNATATGLAAGNYTVFVQDSHGCTGKYATVQVVDPPIISIIPTIVNPTCYGGANGYITLNVSGGTGPYTYSWSGNVGRGNKALNLTAGNYSCTVTDSKGCTSTTGTLTVNNPAALNFTITGATNVCANPSSKSTYTITNNDPYAGPYQYIWSNSTGIPTSSTSNSNSTLYTFNNPSVSPVTISCQVIDLNGCTATFYLPVYVYSIGGFTLPAQYIINGGPLTQCTGSTLHIEVTNSDGIGSWNDPYATTSTDIYVDKNYFDPGLGFARTNSVSIISAVGNGTSITYTTATPHGFTGNSTEYITVSGIIPANFNTVGLATILSPTSFSLPSSATRTATNYSTAFASTTYIDLIWTEIGGSGNCSLSSDPIRVYAPQPITLSASVTAVTCNGPSPNVGAITINMLSGCAPYTFSWTRDGAGGIISTAQNLTALVSDMYHVTITDANGNTATYSIKVPVNIPDINVHSVIQTCNGLSNGAINITPTGGTSPYTYIWTSPTDPTFYQTTQNISNLANGYYLLELSDHYGCHQVFSFKIVDAVPAVADLTVIPPSCPGMCDGEIKWNFTTSGGTTGPYTYSWYDDKSITTPYRQGLCSGGTYTLLIKDGNSCGCCTYIQNVTIPPPYPPITITSIVTDPNGQTGTLGSINITSTQGGGGPGYTYTWYDGNGNPLCGGGTGKLCTSVLTNLTSGTYYVTVSGPNSACAQSFSFTLSAKCTMFSVPELKLQLYKFQCCAGKLAEKYVQYQNVGRADLAQCLLADLKYLTLALEALTCITDLPDPCLSCDDISNILDQMKKICDCDCCLDAGDHTYQMSYNYTTGVFTPILPAIN